MSSVNPHVWHQLGMGLPKSSHVNLSPRICQLSSRVFLIIEHYTLSLSPSPNIILAIVVFFSCFYVSKQGLPHPSSALPRIRAKPPELSLIRLQLLLFERQHVRQLGGLSPYRHRLGRSCRVDWNMLGHSRTFFPSKQCKQ